eukprot:1184400-Rhodomonas_salina.1
MSDPTACTRIHRNARGRQVWGGGGDTSIEMPSGSSSRSNLSLKTGKSEDGTTLREARPRGVSPFVFRGVSLSSSQEPERTWQCD